MFTAESRSSGHARSAIGQRQTKSTSDLSSAESWPGDGQCHEVATTHSSPATSSSNQVLSPWALNVLLISNEYAGLSWNRCSSDSNSMELKSNRDIERILGWTARFGSLRKHIINVKNATKNDIVYALQQARAEPSIIYLNGHASGGGSNSFHSFTYWPSDCFTEDDAVPSNGVASGELGELLSSASQKLPIMVVTDFSYCSNFLKLPFVLKEDNQGDYYWGSTGDEPSSSKSEDEPQILFHFAGAESGGPVHEFESTGGIFTREFCNVNPRSASLTQWARQMRDGVARFINAYNDMHSAGQQCLSQVPQIYSSHRWDVNSPNVLKDLGFCPN